MARLVGTILILALGAMPVTAAEHRATETPGPLVATYESLADTILAAKKSEWNLVHAILATTYGHAEATMAEAVAKLEAGGDAGPAIESLATLVAQLGNEGDASIAAIRKRLTEGGHHHNAAGEKSGQYDEGFVIVTRDVKKGFLDASKRIGRLAAKPDLAELQAAWTEVKRQFGALHAGTH